MEIDEVQEMMIADFFDMCDKDGGKYQIDTPDGWHDINFLVKKKNKSCYNLITEKGIELGCSENHKVLTRNGWKETKDINVQNDVIVTKNGDDNIVAKEYIGIKDTFDLNVNSKEHRYFSNNIVSHNCGKSLTCKVISDLWGMPLLRLDFGKLFGSLVGDSERNAREALRIAEVIAPCVTYDTPIRLKNKQEIIGKLYDNIENKIRIDGKTDIGILKQSLKIKSFSETENNIVENNLKAIIRRKVGNKKVYKVTLKNGKTIKVTEDHKFMVVNNEGNKIWEKMKDIKERKKISTISTLERNVMTKQTEIVKIEEIENIDYVYDPCCDYPHNYISNDIISHNCILWIDEIEKGLSGIQSSGSTDGGTTSRVLSTFLTWMQEKEKPVFVVATANDHRAIPPEFQRAGRFDEIFFVDLPSVEEKKEIFESIFNRKKIDFSNVNLNLIIDTIEGYSGAEIEKVIEEAMLIAFEDKKRPIATSDIMQVIDNFKPLSEIRKEEFEEMREWAKSRCLVANSSKNDKDKTITSRKRKLDI